MVAREAEVRGFLWRWLMSFAAVFFAAWLLPGQIYYRDVQAVALFALVLALLNAFVRPVLLLLTLPLSCLTLGLFTLVINGLMFWLAARLLDTGVSVSGFWGAFLGALVVSAVSFFASRLLR